MLSDYGMGGFCSGRISGRSDFDRGGDFVGLIVSGVISINNFLCFYTAVNTADIVLTCSLFFTNESPKFITIIIIPSERFKTFTS